MPSTPVNFLQHLLSSISYSLVSSSRQEDKLASSFGDDARVLALIHSLFDAGRHIHNNDIFAKRHSWCSSTELRC
ncbi:hypothetical protein GQ457_01G006410 [Hibiscus cannabinus]